MSANIANMRDNTRLISTRNATRYNHSLKNGIKYFIIKCSNDLPYLNDKNEIAAFTKGEDAMAIALAIDNGTHNKGVYSEGKTKLLTFCLRDLYDYANHRPINIVKNGGQS